MEEYVRSKYPENKSTICILGQGSFGSVYHVTKGNEEIAVKIVDLSKSRNKPDDVFVFFPFFS
jgi:hypothetical protein